MRRMIAIAAAGLCRRYGRRWALTEVDFEVPEGALVMVTGRNGSGKSTLLRVLATAIRADRGTVRILGYDVHRDREQVRERTALLGHRTHLYEPLTALENLAVVHRERARYSIFPGPSSVLGRRGWLARSGSA
jgi:heme exporter protein A